MKFMLFTLGVCWCLRVMMYGERGVGKTSLIHRHLYDDIRGVRVNIGADHYPLEDVDLWDLSGGNSARESEFRAWLQPVDLAVLVFSVTDRVNCEFHTVLGWI